MRQATFNARFGILAALTGFIVQPAMAAPFCLQNQVIPPQCIYYDAQQCQKEATRQNAECSANPAETHLSGGYGKYCVVTSAGASVCNYTEQATCTREANKQNGACVQSPTSQPFQQPNPYSKTEGY